MVTNWVVSSLHPIYPLKQWAPPPETMPSSRNGNINEGVFVARRPLNSTLPDLELVQPATTQLLRPRTAVPASWSTAFVTRLRTLSRSWATTRWKRRSGQRTRTERGDPGLTRNKKLRTGLQGIARLTILSVKNSGEDRHETEWPKLLSNFIASFARRESVQTTRRGGTNSLSNNIVDNMFLFHKSTSRNTAACMGHAGDRF